MPNDPELAAKAIRALNEGRKVERRDSQAHQWERCGTDHLSYLLLHHQLDSNRLRIAPEPTFVPWTFEDAPEAVKVIRKENGAKGVLCLSGDGMTFDDVYDQPVTMHTFQEVFEQYVLLDGQPCGKAAQS